MNPTFRVIGLLGLLVEQIALAQTVPLCFSNTGLKNEERIHLTHEGGRIRGEWLIDRDYDAAKRERYPFSAQQQGAALTITFSGGRQPDGMPPNRNSFTWRIEKDTLKVERYGRNHVTQEWASYTANYEPCLPDHAALLRAAKRVGFVRGASSATLNLTFTAARERQAFVLNLGKGQYTTVDAGGCGITLYYPDGKRHDETAIDHLHIPLLALSGDYLVVLSPTEAPGRYEATFSARQAR